MARSTAALLVLAALSAVVRLHNVVVFPELRAPDGFGHFAYIWHFASTGTVPLATSGWSFFHPPLYYAWMASLFSLFDGLPATTRLKIGTGAIALAGLAHAFVVHALVRRRFPGRTVLAVAAPGFLLFLPVQLYSAGYLGNEALHAVLCSLALLATVRLLEKPGPARAAALGLLLGLALLTKFTALALACGAAASLAVVALLRGRVRATLPLGALAAAVALLVCGWFYARNVAVYGDPFQMSRDTLAVRRVENLQTQGRRSAAEFLLFDPMIVVRPQWPRGMPLVGELPPGHERSALRESVWTGMFANTFFDAVGNQVLPPVTFDESARRAGQVLLALALVPTALVLVGLAATLARLLRRRACDVDVTVALCFAASIGLFVVGARAVPMHAAVKATYLASSWAMFGYWLACGLDVVERRLPALRAPLLAACAALAAVAVVVFTQSAFVCRDFLDSTWRSATWQNAYGVVAYAGGDRDAARRLFERAALADWHLAQENLAALAWEEGRLEEARYRLRLAARLQPGQSFGLPTDKADFERVTQAEYRNALGAVALELGDLDEAESLLGQSVRLDDTIPETHYDLGLLALLRAARTGSDEQRRAQESAAAQSFARALELDPRFGEAAVLAAATATGDCRDVTIPQSPTCWTSPRAWPVETLSGDFHSAAILRRRHARLPREIAADLAARGCPPTAGKS